LSHLTAHCSIISDKKLKHLNDNLQLRKYPTHHTAATEHETTNFRSQSHKLIKGFY